MAEKHKRATMGDLAKLAGVDVSTVSRALNDSPLVKPETREQVLRIADEIGYVVNASARNLRRQSSDAIALVIPINPESGETISDPFFLEMVGAVSNAAAQHGYDLIVSVPKEVDTISEARLLRTGRADGMIVIGQAGREERLNQIGTSSSNIVVWGGQIDGANYTLIGSDNLAGGETATRHLVESGRKNIVFIGDISLPEIKLRYEGYKKALDDHKIPIKDELHLNIRFGFEVKTASQKVADLIESGTQFDAIFAASDHLAFAAIEGVRSKGLSVPNDIAVIGYDNIGTAAVYSPALTTIDQNIKASGEALVETLLSKIKGNPVSSTLTPTRLIIRESCGG